MRRNLISIQDLSLSEIDFILKTADSFTKIGERPVKKVPILRGHTVVNLFYEPSTRTRTSFELAAKRLSADVINISSDLSAARKGESLKDTAKTLTAMGADAIVVRHSSSGSPNVLAKWTNIVVINGGDGAHEHPTQALLDLYTIRKAFGSVKGLRIAVVGDIAHSRVARSNILLFKAVGADVAIVAPETLIPSDVEKLGCKIMNSLDEVLPDSDVIYLLRMQKERQILNPIPSFREYASNYAMNVQRVDKLKKGAKLMHPGPMNRGIEISPEVADMDNVLIENQVENGIAVRMAVLYMLLGGENVL